MAFVLAPTNQLIIHVVDSAGKKATSQYYVDDGETDPTSGAPAAIAAAVQGLITGLVYQTEILRHAINDAPGSGTTGNFARVMDKMKLTMNSASAAQVILQIPAPVDALMGADGVKVDPAAAPITALIDYWKLNVVDAEGGDIKTLQNGFRRWPSGLKKGY